MGNFATGNDVNIIADEESILKVLRAIPGQVVYSAAVHMPIFKIQF